MQCKHPFINHQFSFIFFSQFLSTFLLALSSVRASSIGRQAYFLPPFATWRFMWKFFLSSSSEPPQACLSSAYTKYAVCLYLSLDTQKLQHINHQLPVNFPIHEQICWFRAKLETRIQRIFKVNKIVKTAPRCMWEKSYFAYFETRDTSARAHRSWTKHATIGEPTTLDQAFALLYGRWPQRTRTPPRIDEEHKLGILKELNMRSDPTFPIRNFQSKWCFPQFTESKRLTLPKAYLVIRGDKLQTCTKQKVSCSLWNSDLFWPTLSRVYGIKGSSR